LVCNLFNDYKLRLGHWDTSVEAEHKKCGVSSQYEVRQSRYSTANL